MWACMRMSSGDIFLLGSNFYLKNPRGGCGLGAVGAWTAVDLVGVSLGLLLLMVYLVYMVYMVYMVEIVAGGVLPGNFTS